MQDRRFTEVDLRTMLERASKLERDVALDRWRILARHQGRAWRVVLDPDAELRILVVVTAYPID